MSVVPEGLVVERGDGYDPGPLWMKDFFDVLHASSGERVVGGFRERACAVEFAAALAEVADWTLPAEVLKRDGARIAAEIRRAVERHAANWNERARERAAASGRTTHATLAR